LTTFRGFIKFRKLSAKDEEIYQKIKDEKRNIIAQEVIERENPKNPFDNVYDDLLAGKMRNAMMLEGVAHMLGLTPATLRIKLTKRLKEEKKNCHVSDYFWDNKRKDVQVAVALAREDKKVEELLED
jgi:hypothetical protein